MSSAVAMNRRIAKQNGEKVPDFQTNAGNSMNGQQTQRQMPRQAGGTPIQQCWTIMNFHETRLNNIEHQVHLLTSHAKSTSQETHETNDTNLQILMQRMDRLEKENVSLRQVIQKQTSGKNSISLEVSEE
jgi:hypothetical protein